MLSIVLIGLAGFVGCAGQPTNSGTNPEKNPAIAEFERRLAKDGSVSFRSYNGKAYRMDSDTELTFYPNGDAFMLEWGFSGQAFRGNYHVHSDGCLISWFRDYGSEWPVMVLALEGNALLLRPLNPPNGLKPMPPEAATRPAEQRYWQFRALTGDDEKQVLETIKRWGADRLPR